MFSAQALVLLKAGHSAEAAEAAEAALQLNERNGKAAFRKAQVPGGVPGVVLGCVGSKGFFVGCARLCLDRTKYVSWTGERKRALFIFWKTFGRQSNVRSFCTEALLNLGSPEALAAAKKAQQLEPKEPSDVRICWMSFVGGFTKAFKWLCALRWGWLPPH